MQPIIHFLLSILAGIGVGLHLESKIKKALLILFLALATTSIDLDHLLPIYQESGIKILHNMFVFVVIPVALFLIFYVYEHGKGSTIKQRTCLLLCVMFVGHMFTDSISDGLPIYYPFQSDTFMVGNIGITIIPDIFSLTSEQMIMIVWATIICWANLLETLTYREVECRKPFKLGLSDIRTYSKRMRSWFPAIITSLSFRKVQFPNCIKACEDIGYKSEELNSNEDIITQITKIANNLPD